MKTGSISGAGCRPPLGTIKGGITRFDLPEPLPGCAAAALASAAARAEEAPQRLPDFARALERKQERQQKDLQYQTGPAQAEAPKPVRAGAKVGRNDPCPCGSGKKYKKCHGANG